MPAKLQMLGGDFTQRPYIRYSAYADGTDFTETRSAGQNYIGVAVATKAPTDKSGYEWGVLGSNVRETLSLTLKANEWDGNKQVHESVSISENCTIIGSPAVESTQVYTENGVMISGAEVGKVEFSCVTVPTEDIEVVVHIIDPLIAVESTEILSFDSVDEMNAYEAEDGAIAIVPSEGESGGGFPIVELTTIPTDTSEVMLTEAENTALNAVADKDNIFVKFKYGAETPPVLIPMTAYEMEGLPCFTGVYMYSGVNNVYLFLANTGEGWLMVVMGA